MAELIEEFKQDLALFVEAGMVAIKQGDEVNAQKIFNAVRVVDPKHDFVEMGPGLIALHKMDLSKACKHFEALMKSPQKNWRAQAFCSLAHILCIMNKEMPQLEKIESLKKGYALAQEVLDNCEEPTTRQLAQSVLDWENEMKKS